ncbi:hypothetical protein N7478_007078 [Penicillium angulare]|uniref:uncharacterized protein n=1 Tax=Penicillium angulare TaxID=116970 RepID=UPI00253F829F|nr:uncharacterized protein N7478_007078 [Penicillium angulare]KAJ5281706.1 hypothetical protein N7478_007078 [Penicillium angulare]
MPSAGPEELDTHLNTSAMTDLISTPQRPRAATTSLPTVVPPSPIMRHSLQSSSSLHGGSPPLGSTEHDVTSSAQGPLRHPKPLTPSDLHSVLEKEQEAMVNRLTRELSLLRQQTASVASTTSSTSTLNEPPDGTTHGSPSLGSSTHSHSYRRQRSSSSLSSQTPSVQGSQASVTGIAPSRTEHHRTPRSREPSLTHRRPSIGSLNSYTQHPHPDHVSHFGNSPSIYPHRTSVSQTHLGLSSNSLARYEEAALHKSELETTKRENEQLRRRVRELEQILKKQKEETANS